MSRLITAALCTVWVAGGLYAQDETKLPPDRGGRGVGASYIQILEMTEVQDDLELSDEDMANIPVFREVIIEGDLKFDESLQGVAPNEMQEKLIARRAELDGQFKEVLGDKYTRFRQIRLQLDGLFGSATREKEIQGALSIADDQLTKLNEAMGGGDTSKIHSDLGNDSLSPEKRKELLDALEKKQSEAVEKILTAEQKKKWDDLIGPKITYRRPQMQFDQELGRSGGDGPGTPDHIGGGENGSAPPPAGPPAKKPPMVVSVQWNAA